MGLIKPAEKMFKSYADDVMTAAATFATLPAVQDESGLVLSHAELAARVQSLALRLHLGGVQRGTRVVLTALSHVQLLTAFLALSRLGAVAVISSQITEEFCAAVGAKVILAAAVQPVTGMPTMVFPARFGPHTPAETSFVPAGYARGEDLAYIVGSSGSTGVRKLLAISAQHLKRIIADQTSLLPGRLGRVVFAVRPWVQYGLQMSLVTLSQGGCVLWPKTEEDVLALIIAGRADNLVGPPVSFQHLVEKVPPTSAQVGKLSFCIASGSKISQRLAERFRAYYCRKLFVQYGSTEIGPVAFGDTALLAENPDYTGKLAPWVTAWTIAENGERLPDGEPGRFVFELAGARATAPYLDPAVGSTVPSQRYVSEDYGRITGGNLVVESRESERVNVGGNKYTLPGIKAAIAAKIKIPAEFELISIASEAGFDRLVMVIVGDQKELGSYIDKLNTSGLFDWHWQAMFVNRFPLNDFGKIDLARLKAAAEHDYRQFLAKKERTGGGVA